MPSRRRSLALEPLEELLLLSVAPSSQYEDWQQQTFSLGAQHAVDAQSTLAALANQSLPLVGGLEVHAQYGYTGAGYAVAVLDTGIDYNHPALAGRYLGGWDFVDRDADPMDEHGHGTHVAGIIASSHGSYRGIAPQAGIVALRILDENGSGTFANVELALQWVAAHQAQYNIVAVNMSLGAGNFTASPWAFLEDEFTTLRGQAVFLAAASGNAFYSYGSQQGLGYPAISSQTVSVGAVWDGEYGTVAWASGAKDHSTAPDRIASFTQRSSQLDILAPGAFVTSTWLGGGLATLAGTSMAAPLVAGAAVLVHQALDARGQGASANQDQILTIMRASGVTLVDGDDENDNVINTGLRYQRLDLLAAIRSLDSLPAAVPRSSMDAFVSSLYEHVLARPADAAGLAAWSGALAGGMPRDRVVQALWMSAEHRALQVTGYYQAYLQRTPGRAERDRWVAAMQSGMDEIEVQRVFLQSPEYLNARADDAAFVNGVYQDLLGRAADTAGLAGWVSQLRSGLSRGQVVDGVLNSAERTLRVIGQHYQDYLGRAAGQAEGSYWATAVGQGRQSLAGVAQSVLASQEYFNRAPAGNAASAGASAYDSPELHDLSAYAASNALAGIASARATQVAFHDWSMPDDDSRRMGDHGPLVGQAVATAAECLVPVDSQLVGQVPRDVDADDVAWRDSDEILADGVDAGILAILETI
ncbi:MAG: S8 family serine peptidase [Pirellulales bacterium]